MWNKDNSCTNNQGQLKMTFRLSQRTPPLLFFILNPLNHKVGDSNMVSEVELKRQRFKLISAQFGGICSFCGKRFIKNSRIYWKREEIEPRKYVTKLCCFECCLPKEKDIEPVRIEKKPHQSTLET